MEREEFVRRAQEAAELVDAGELDRARVLLRTLVASDIPDGDKAVLCVNLAIVADKLGDAGQALDWYDEGIAYERADAGTFVAESKAAYLAEHGRDTESLALYEHLLLLRDVDDATMERVRHNIRLLRERGRSGSPGRRSRW